LPRLEQSKPCITRSVEDRKVLLCPEEEDLVNLIANIAVSQTLKQAYEKSN